MKAFIKYISLLLFSGLMLPFYSHNIADLSKLKKLSPASAILGKARAQALRLIADIVIN